MPSDPCILVVEVALQLLIVVCRRGTHEERSGWNPHIDQPVFRVHFGLGYWRVLAAVGRVSHTRIHRVKRQIRHRLEISDSPAAVSYFGGMGGVNTVPRLVPKNATKSCFP